MTKKKKRSSRERMGARNWIQNARKKAYHTAWQRELMAGSVK